MTAAKLGPFPVDDETLNVVRDSIDRVCTGHDEDDRPIYDGSPFGLEDVLNLLSGYDPTKVVPLVDEDGHEVPDWFEYVGGQVYHSHDVIRALIDEIRRLRAASQ